MKFLLIVSLFISQVVTAQIIKTVVVPPSTKATTVTFKSSVKQTVTATSVTAPGGVIPIDTVIYNIINRDTLIYRVVNKDTIILRITYKDTVIVKPPVIDTTKPPVPPVGKIAYLTLPVSAKKNINGSNIVIDGLRFENIDGVAINITGGNNITIRNCFFNKAVEEAISIENASNVTVENCLFNGVVTGVYALSSNTIKVRNNQFVNVRMRPQGGRGQFVQFNGVGGAGNIVENNKGENFQGESDPEDMISMYASSGTAASPILIRNNMFRGGGPSKSGGGIILGDHGGQYAIADGNILLNPGQYGMSIAGGSNLTITNNKIFSKQFAWSNNPLFIWQQTGSTTCANNVIKSNRATWTDKNGANNGGWNAENCSNTTWQYPTAITEAELNVPVHLIDFITPAELLKIRGK